MDKDIRSQLREAFERELPAVLDRASGPDGLITDRLVLQIFSALLRDPDQHRDLLDRDVGAQREWLLAQVDEADAPLGSADDSDVTDECVRAAATAWVEQYFDGELAPSSEPGLWGHLDDCVVCRARYRELRVKEDAGDDALQRRTRRLARGLPWSSVPQPERELDLEPEATSDVASAAKPTSAADSEVDSEDDDQGADRRFWLTRRGRWIAYAIAILLFVLSQAGLWLMPATRPIGLQEQGGRTRVVDPLPDQGLSMALLRYQPNSLHDMPWRNVQSAVAAGDRLLVTYSLDEGKNKQRGRPRFLTIVAIDDKGRLHWLRPSVRKSGNLTSPRVAIPVRGAKLPQEIRAPRGVSRLVIYAVVTDAAVHLSTIGHALRDGFRRVDFATAPPILNIDRSIQYYLVLDVLR